MSVRADWWGRQLFMNQNTRALVDAAHKGGCSPSWRRGSGSHYNVVAMETGIRCPSDFCPESSGESRPTSSQFTHTQYLQDVTGLPWSQRVGEGEIVWVYKNDTCVWGEEEVRSCVYMQTRGSLVGFKLLGCFFLKITFMKKTSFKDNSLQA